jgi:hypothetical protein
VSNLGGKIMAIFLIVVLVALSIYLASRWWSVSRTWQPQRDRLLSEIRSHEATIELAKRLVAHDNLARDWGWRLWAGSPEEQQVLARYLEEDTPKDVDSENIDYPPPPIAE